MLLLLNIYPNISQYNIFIYPYPNIKKKIDL